MFLSPSGDGSHTTGRIDLYKRGCFVLEAKQGSDAVAEPAPLFATSPLFGAGASRRGTAIRGTAGWDAAMVKVRNQADRYVHALPQGETDRTVVVYSASSSELGSCVRRNCSKNRFSLLW